MNTKSIGTIQINIDEVLLHLENPRFEKVASQEEAIEIMLNEYEDKIYNLAKHIVENGINPTELAAVIKNENGKYTVLDGNRRLTALKILNNPELISGNFNKLKLKIMKLNRTEIPLQINAMEFSTEEEANIWINLKHTGENEGVGTVSWDSIQQSRFNNEKYPLSIQLLKYMEKAKLFDNMIIASIKNLKITNLERLLSDPDVRKELSISRLNNELHFPIPSEYISNVFNNLLSDLLSDDFTVNIIRRKPDRMKYIASFKEKYNLLKNDLTEPKDEETTTLRMLESNMKNEKEANLKEMENEKKLKTNDDDVARRKLPKEEPDTISRTTLIPKNTSLLIKNTKINDIYKELKNIQINDYPNIVGAAFRVFLELSIDYYITEMDVVIGKNDTLSSKLEKTKKDINDRLNLDKNELKDISRAISSNDNIVSIDVLHGYIHSTMAQASADGLKTTWNNYEHFIKLLHQIVNK